MGRLFRSRMDVDTAKNIFFKAIRPIERKESVPLEAANGRVLASDIEAEQNVPHYKRAAMDGYALKANDTLGAAAPSPVLLTLTNGDVGPGTCHRVHTGSAIPKGADAVVMLEDTRASGTTVEILSQLHPGKHVGAIGEDVAAGELLLSSGHLLRPGDMAVLASTGISDVEIYHRPLVAIIPTGEEVVPMGKPLEAGQVWETNSLMTACYVRQAGGFPRINDIVTDDPELIRQAIQDNSDADMIVISGGTSVGERDHVPAAVEALGELLVHGVAISPGKPTALGVVEGKPILCMPGYPVAGLVALLVFGIPALQKLGHIPPRPETVVSLPLKEKITSRQGYQTYVRVRITDGSVEPVMASGAGILSSVAKADGYVVVPPNIEGYGVGTEVDVIWF
ncbi:MAG: molybdopterin molybdotransferase MoeA [ANME-2 cluster archaeon]|jgi:molybdopterin molybdotransferase|nr:molybdopterin molybdotransferase MoeA [ANME-2 cluster archaeon]